VEIPGHARFTQYVFRMRRVVVTAVLDDTKMVLLGEVWWHDEDDFGTADVIGFRPQRLWIRKRREIIGINRAYGTREWAVRLGVGWPVS
jgi:hypothetical protein